MKSCRFLEEDNLYLIYSDLMAKSCHTGDDEEEGEDEDAGKSFEVFLSYFYVYYCLTRKRRSQRFFDTNY